MKWYFACNDQSPAYDYMIRAAVESAIKNTSLVPHFVYDGTPGPLTLWLEQKGVKVIRHRVTFYDSLQAFYSPQELKTASGTFLRCDIPLLETNDELVLYTDCDVIFASDIQLQDIQYPVFFACAPEGIKTDRSFFNTGVMLMNIPALRETHHDFETFIETSLTGLNVYDQTAYNRFYANQSAWLPLEYNWKPYWGENPDAKIIHFHGPKPHDLVRMLTGEPVTDIYERLFAMDRLGCIRHLSLFCEYSEELSVNRETAWVLGSRFLVRALEEKEEELKAANKKRLWKRLKKNCNRLIRKKTL